MRTSTHRWVTGALIALCLVVTAACSGGPTPAEGVRAQAARVEAQQARAAVKKAAEQPPLPASASLPDTSYPAVKRPNILVIETDDMRADDLEAMPNVQKLIADRGLSFENSFAPYPLCCPSRSSFMTGKYSHNHHVLSHVDPYGFQAFDDRTTIATVLQKRGYRTALVGKYLNGYGQQPTHLTRRPSVHYVPPGWTAWRAGLDHRWPAGSPNRGGTYHYFSMTENVDGRVRPHPGLYSSNLTAAQTRLLIDQFGAKDSAKRRSPWFIWWTPTAPHFGSPREPDDPKPLVRGDGRREVIKTPARPDWVKGKFDDRIVHPPGSPPYGPSEKDIGDKPRFMRVPEMDRAERAAVTESARQRAESLYALDRQVGLTLQRLRSTKQLARTLIVFTSDNGYFLGEHRRRQGKTLPHEPSLRVPLLIAGPGVPRGKRYDPATTIDLAPTFAAYAGTTMPGADGRDLRLDIDGPDRGWSLPLVTEGLIEVPGYQSPSGEAGFDSALNVRGVRTGRWKYVKYADGENELYDLLKDPLEMHNRAGDPSYDAVRARLDEVWAQFRACAGAACRVPLPADLRLDAADNRSITEHQSAQTEDFYQN